MTKHIIKIRPYRVFKKDGLHYVKINNKKVYVRHGASVQMGQSLRQIRKV